MRISVKSFTLAVVGVLIALLVAQASIAVYRMQSLHHVITQIATDRLPDIQLLGEIDAQTTRYRLRASRYILAPSPDRKAEIAVQLRLSESELQRDFGAYENRIGSDAERSLWADFLSDWSGYCSNQAEAIAASTAGNTQLARSILENSRSLFLEATRTLHATINHSNALTSAQLDSADTSYGDGIVAIVAFGCIAVVLGVSLAAFSVMKVSDPLVALTHAMRRIAEGDLAHDVPAQASRNEIGDMATALVVLRDGLAEAERLRQEQRGMDMANLRLMHEAQVALDAYANQLDELVIEKTQHLAEREREIVWRLSRATERRDTETGNHIARMSRISGMIAEALGLPKHQCSAIEIGAQMHDIGKVGIPDDILFKNGTFTPKERQVMETHAQLGWEILQGSESELIQAAAEIALAHHERWDGNGYPHGLAGETIPLSARIAAIADVFDALTSERPYKKAWPVADALGYIDANSGTHFDPACVAAFRQRLDHIVAIAGTTACDVASSVQAA
ncbi:MAG: MCP four helix bundle domain-containing protein [Ancalomicrobiaceae bacterium]|nr:MCP four helix bundle domain-containing protein [Ancalomicrobiaceae bacterium]